MANYAVQHNLDAIRNDTFKHTITNVLDRSGNPMVWTGVTARMQVRENRGANPILDISTPVQIDLSVTGQISFNLDESLMDKEGKEYLYDIEFTKADDRLTGITGKFIVHDDITHD